MKILKQRMLSYSYSLSSALASILKRMLQKHVSKVFPNNRTLAWSSAPLEAKWNYSSSRGIFPFRQQQTCKNSNI